MHAHRDVSLPEVTVCAVARCAYLMLVLAVVVLELVVAGFRNLTFWGGGEGGCCVLC